MAGTNDFLPFAIGGGANVLPQVDYAALPALGTGFQSGTAVSEQLNKVWRQSATMAAVIARFIIDQIPTADVLDNGDLDAIVTSLIAAIQQAGIAKPTPVLVTSSDDFVADVAVAIYGLNRTVGVAAQTITLPNGMVPGQEQMYQDLVGNLASDAAPVTLVPPAGQISGRSNYVMNEDRQTAIITYYGTNIYGVRTS